MRKNGDMENEYLSMLEQNIGILIKISRVYAATAQDRKELISDMIYELWRSYPKFRGESKISTWVYRVALNVALKGKRKRDNGKILLAGELLTFDTPSRLDSAEDDTSETIGQLYRCIERLDPMNKAVILLYLDEKSTDEIAEITGISKTNVSTRLTRIRQRLKQCMVKNDGYGN